jgi:GntR family transcriptional regulator, transcriptional repressor for pyruvate dehydrogenase complex
MCVKNVRRASIRWVSSCRARCSKREGEPGSASVSREGKPYTKWLDNPIVACGMKIVFKGDFSLFNNTNKGIFLTRFDSLKRPLLSKTVELAITSSIHSEVFKPGVKLPPERELAEQFGVSRMTIREALRNLQRSGLISIKRGIYAGSYVTEPTAAPISENFNNLIHMGVIDYSHLFDARLFVEPRTAEIAALNRTDEDIKNINDLLDRAEAQTDKSPMSGRLLNVTLHYELAKITKNPIIIFITESITQSYSTLIINRTHSLLKREHVLKFISEHREIVNSIIERDAAGAFMKTRKHLIETYFTYQRMCPENDKRELDFRIREEGNRFSRIAGENDVTPAG